MPSSSVAARSKASTMAEAVKEETTEESAIHIDPEANMFVISLYEKHVSYRIDIYITFIS